jgi:hypothetical protein
MKIECIRNTKDTADQTSDASYVVNNPPAPAVQSVPASPRIPYFASLLIDQSGSIKDSDPTDARIFATKVFLDGVMPSNGFGDVAALSAFAETNQSATALIPTQPVTNFGFSTIGRDLFGDLDTLATLEGGGTPLYKALDEMITYTRNNAGTGGKAVVLFTDGRDTACNQPIACRNASISLARDQDPKVDIFTIGLSDAVDFEELSDLAERGNGYFLFAESAEQLIPIYGSLGALLSKSLSAYTMTWQIQTSKIDAFEVDRAVLGQLRISTGTNVIELPFVVRIF